MAQSAPHQSIVPWLISGASLLYSFIKDFATGAKAEKKRRADWEASMEARVQELEVNRRIDLSTLAGEFRLINERIGRTNSQVGQASTLIQSILDHA